MVDATQDFLRLSRASVDDSITEALNALSIPSASGFDPQSTLVRSSRKPSGQLDSEACREFRDKVLFPTWQTRSDLLHYCALVATGPDPNDPTASLQESERVENKERTVDERLDPYSARFWPTEPRTQALANLVRTECGVEDIVRARTWEVVTRRCGPVVGSWKVHFNAYLKDLSRRRTGGA